jgi:hypothetical protein
MRLLPPVIYLPSVDAQVQLIIGLYDLGITYDAAPSAPQSWDAFNRDTRSGASDGKDYPWIAVMDQPIYLTAFKQPDDMYGPRAIMNSVNHFLWYTKRFKEQPPLADDPMDYEWQDMDEGN